MRDDRGRIRPQRIAIFARQTKVANLLSGRNSDTQRTRRHHGPTRLDNAAIGVEQIGRLEIAMQYPVGVHVCRRRQQLLHDACARTSQQRQQHDEDDGHGAGRRTFNFALQKLVVHGLHERLEVYIYTAQRHMRT